MKKFTRKYLRTYSNTFYLLFPLYTLEPFSVVLQFTPGFDGNSSITQWTVQALNARNATWTTIYSTIDPDAKSIVVKNLTPYMEYQLRLLAHNVVGASEPSDPTKEFQTIQV